MNIKISFVGLAGIVVAVAALFASASEAKAAHTTGLLVKVNDAIVKVGAPLTVERSNAFQVGVVSGHYTTFDQLVGAVSFHFQRGTLPTFASSKAHAAVLKKCIRGNVLSISDVSLSIRGDLNGEQVEKTIKLATNQYTMALARGIKAGSVVTVCSANLFRTQYGHLTRHDS